MGLGGRPRELGAAVHLLEPYLADNPWVSKDPPLCRGLWALAGLGRAQGQGGAELTVLCGRPLSGPSCRLRTGD